jgi:hypothetical protein
MGDDDEGPTCKMDASDLVADEEVHTLQRKNYTTDQDCSWKIYNNENRKIKLEVTWTSIKLDSNGGCRRDYLTIFDGSKDEGRILDTICGINYEKRTFYSSGSEITVQFQSDEWKDKNYEEIGFTVTYSLPDPEEVRAHELDEASKGLSFWCYSCKHCAEVDVQKTPKEICPATSKCYTRISYGSYALDIERGCVENRAKGHYFTLNEKSQSGCFNDRSDAYSEWCFCDGDLCNVQKQKKSCGNPEETRDGETFTATNTQEKEFSQDSYGHNWDCSWIFEADDANSVVKLDVKKLSIEETWGKCYDFMNVFDGADSSSSTLIRHICEENHPFTLYSTGPVLSLQFHSDWVKSKRGWKIMYSSIPASDSPSELKDAKKCYSCNNKNCEVFDPSMPLEYCPDGGKCYVMKGHESYPRLEKHEFERGCTTNRGRYYEGLEEKMKDGPCFSFSGDTCVCEDEKCNTMNKEDIVIPEPDQAPAPDMCGEYDWNTYWEGSNCLETFKMCMYGVQPPLSVTCPQGYVYDIHTEDYPQCVLLADCVPGVEVAHDEGEIVAEVK